MSAHLSTAPSLTAMSDDESSEAAGCHPMFRTAPTSVSFNKLRKRLLRQARRVIDDYSMLATSNDSRPRWLVALSGGKDSYGLLAVLLDLQWRGLLPVDLLACNLDQGQPNFPKYVLPQFFEELAVPYRIEYRDTYSIVTDKIPEGNTYCALCSRLRRGHLYRIAREEGCQAVVLGHHREDILETFFLNLIHGGQLSAMPAKLLNDDGDLMVLRPLAYSAEDDLAKFAEAMEFPIIPCDLCGSQDGLQRNAMKEMLGNLEHSMPGRKETMLRALRQVRPSHLLDRDLFSFSELAVTSSGKDDLNQIAGFGSAIESN